MFERFTDRARRVLVLAQDEARALEHNFLGTEHLLLGLIKEGEGVGAVALTELGATHASLRDHITAVITPGEPGAASGSPPFTPRSKKVLELALSEALDLGHNYIGTEHLLLGLVREGEGVAAQVLIRSGLDLSTVRKKVIELLLGHAAANPRAPGRTTPAATMLETRAKALAGTQAIGSHHYLLAVLEDSGSLGARVLASLGVTREAVDTRIKEIGVAGTTDEVKLEATSFRVSLGEGMSIQVDDPNLIARVRENLIEKGKGEGLGEAVRNALAGWLDEQKQQPEEPPADEPPAGEPPAQAKE
jgi:ATP-dependent Clp protease ATP-binding subunit ClpA